MTVWKPLIIGPNGRPVEKSGIAVPEGGNANQVLTKNTNSDFDASWISPVKQAVVSLPYASLSHRGITVTDAAVSVSSKILLSLAGVPETSENASDCIDLLSMLAVPGSGSFEFQANFLTPVGGALTINYAIG